MLGAIFIFAAGVGTGIGLGYGLWGEPNWVGVDTTPSPPVGPDYLDLEVLELGKIRGVVQVGFKIDSVQ